jgi:hypothetical protein
MYWNSTDVTQDGRMRWGNRELGSVATAVAIDMAVALPSPSLVWA